MSPPHTLIKNQKRVEADTIRKSRFFHAIDFRGPKIIATVCKEENVNHDTSKLWLLQRKRLTRAGLNPFVAFRRIGKFRSGRSKKITTEKYDEMLNVDKNLMRDMPWEIQINHFELNCTARTFQRHDQHRRLKAELYKMVKIKNINSKNKRLRIEYGLRHKNEIIESFWQYVHFTNEAHIDLNQTYSKRVLREKDTRYEPQNLQSMPDMKGVKLHFAISISWHHKGPLLFYNDKHDSSSVVIKKLSKSRKSKYQTNDQYKQRLIDWEVSLPHDSEMKLKDNFITQIYCTERLLPVYAQKINEARVFVNRRGILQEDKDNSHETRSLDNIVKRFKNANWIETLIHSPQSFDLNSIEACWNILKQRVRRRQRKTIAQLKEVLLDEWDKVTMNEIRARINEMPSGCKQVIKSKDKAMKSVKW